MQGRSRQTTQQIMERRIRLIGRFLDLTGYGTERRGAQSSGEGAQ
jgi:hypothetical protein